MIPAKAENLLINVDQLPRQEIRRPGSDVWDLNLNYSISYLDIYIDIYDYVQHTRQAEDRTQYLEQFYLDGHLVPQTKWETNPDLESKCKYAAQVFSVFHILAFKYGFNFE